MLGIGPGKMPSCLILLFTSDMQDGYSSLVRSLGAKRVKPTCFSHVSVGIVDGEPLAFGCSYAGSLTADIVHAFCVAGIREVIGIGFCGSLDTKLQLGDLVISEKIVGKDGVSDAYVKDIHPDFRYVEQWVDCFPQSKKATILSWKNLFSESTEDIQAWLKSGIKVVDLESAALFSVCQAWSVPCVSILIVADNITKQERLHDVYRQSYRLLGKMRKKTISVVREHLKNKKAS